MTTNPDLDQAREWARTAINTPNNFPKGRAAAEVINALPDEWIDADKLRDVINGQLSSYPHGTVGHHVAEEIACKLGALFPAPQPRTLADMTREERETCQWMQADMEQHGRGIITCILDDSVQFMKGNGLLITVWEKDYGKVIPLPDLRRMVWPDEQAIEEDMSIIPPKIDTSTGHDDYVDMTPQDVPAGEVWVVSYGDGRAVGMREYSEYRPWYVMWDNQDLQIESLRLGDADITLVSRLAPEVEA